MKNRNDQTWLICLVTSFLGLADAQLSAQTSDAATEPIIDLPTTVVTGDLWASELQETTASISVVNTENFAVTGIQQFDDISVFIPNLTTTGGTSRTRYIQLRGIGENSQYEGETPDAAIIFLMDDLDFTGLGSLGSLFDVKQVEVLRGPQAGAFGANAGGGVIHFLSQDPTSYWTGNLAATVGSDSLLSSEFGVGGPLVVSDPDKLTIRLAMQRTQSDGFIHNQHYNVDDTNARDETSMRLKLRWLASEQWQWDTTLFYANVDNGYDVFSMGNTAYETESDEPGRDEQESSGVSLKGQFHLLQGGGFTTKASLMHSDSLYSYDADWTAASYAGYLATWRDRDVFSEEFRFDSSADAENRWTIGAYYQNLNEDTDVLYRDGDPSGGEWDYGQVNVSSNYETETAAIFAQLSHAFSETTRLIVGLRLENHQVTFDSRSDEEGYYQGYLYDGISENEDTVFGGKLTLEHDLSADSMVFASIAKGYKAGGANSGTFTSPEFPAVYDHETLWNFETGLRSWLVDNSISLQITGFYLYRLDPQLRDSVGAGGFFRYLTVNGESATHYGLESELQWKLSTEWNLTAGLGLLHAERDGYSDPGGWIPGRELANAPAVSYNLRVDYRGESGVFGSVSVAGRSSYYESNSNDQKRDAASVINASAGYQFGFWKLSVWVKNLLDAENPNRVFFFDNGEGEQRYEALADPMQIGSTLSYQF